jgi:hypothetical protein
MTDDTTKSALEKRELREMAANWNEELCVSKCPCRSLDDRAIVRGFENRD